MPTAPESPAAPLSLDPNERGPTSGEAVAVVARDGRCLYSPGLPGMLDARPWELCWEAAGRERLREAFVEACMFRRRRRDVVASLRLGERLHDVVASLDPAGPELVIARFAPRPATTLTPREREVLTLVAGEATNARIARRLGASEATIRTHLKNLRDKLGVRRAEGLLLAAAQRGVV